ncbi:MAG: hypothetical protein IFK93_09695 [Acidobacteria bacterium]|nr:hypothetical protein [Candidatus Sulfomarinibacter kjeldsenii]
MSRSALSVFVFSIYLYVFGFMLIVIPDTLLRIFKFPDADGLWIRIVGMLMIILGFYYSHAARSELRAFFVWTVIARTSVLLFFVAFVIAGFAPTTLILFGVIDFAAAMWTLLAMRSDTATPPSG